MITAEIVKVFEGNVITLLKFFWWSTSNCFNGSKSMGSDADISNRERPLMAHLRRSANGSNERGADEISHTSLVFYHALWHISR
jgi:hypothetical protein